MPRGIGLNLQCFGTLTRKSLHGMTPCLLRCLPTPSGKTVPDLISVLPPTILHNALVQQSSHSPCDRSMEVVPQPRICFSGGLVEAGYSVDPLGGSWVFPDQAGP